MTSAAKRELLCSAVLALLPSAHALADEGGTSFWVPGQYANHAALAPQQGWSLPVQFYYYNGSAPASAASSSAVPPGTRSQTLQLSLTPTYTPATSVLGGQLALFASVGIAENTTEQNQSAQATPVKQTAAGLTDLVPGALLSWTHGTGNWLVYLTANIPIGDYDSQRIANVGIGHAAADAGGGYTYFSSSSGLSWSGVVGFTYNFENYSTDYRNGIDSHLGWGVIQSLSPHLHVGAAGYVYYQLTGDSGSGDNCGPCKSRVASLGPQVTYTFTVAGQVWSADLRAYYEFWAQNRLEGASVFATLSIPFGGR